MSSVSRSRSKCLNVQRSRVVARAVSKLEEYEVEHTQPKRDVPVFKPGIGDSEDNEGGSRQGIRFATGRAGGGNRKHLETDL